MKAKWIITLYGQDDDVNSLYYTIASTGREVEVVTLKHMFEEIIDKPSQEKACVIVTGPTSVTIRLGRSKSMWVPGTYHLSDTYKCSNYYAYIGEHLTQRKYTFLPLAEIDRTKDYLYEQFGVEDKIFIRPDIGEKAFTGLVVHKNQYKNWKETRDCTPLSTNILCVVSSPVKIERELRLIMHKGKVVTGSTYYVMGMKYDEPLEEQPNKQAIIEFAENAASKLKEFPPVYVMDIAVDEFGLSVMEVGCVNCAGWYASDLRKTVEAMSEAAEFEYTDYFE